MDDIDIPHLRLPFDMEDGHAAEVEQDGMGDVSGCVFAILRTPLKHREEFPEFGTKDPTFTSPPDIDRLRRSVARLEPRAESTVEHEVDAFDRGLHRARVFIDTGEVE